MAVGVSLHDPLQPVQLASVTGYLVEYTSHCDDQQNTTQVGNVSTTIIRGLYSYINYTLRMTVVCNSTVSPTFSPPHIFITPSKRKPHYCPVYLSLPTTTAPRPHPAHSGVMVAPENVTVETLNTTTLVVRWQALDPCDWSGEPEGYVVRCTLTLDLGCLRPVPSLVPTLPVAFGLRSPSCLQITVTDLTSGRVVRENVSWHHQTVHLVIGSRRRYNVSVSAVNSEGEGPPSIPVTSPVDGM